MAKRRKPGMVFTGSMCDPYMHIEEELKLTRGCLEAVLSHGFGACVLTKSTLVLRDLDILKSINARTKSVVCVTLTTYDEDLCKILEPKAPTTSERFSVLEAMRDENIPTVVWLCPTLPFINDSLENLEGLLDYCARAKVYGILCFGFGLTLRDGSREFFYSKLDEFFPGAKDVYKRAFDNSYECLSPNNAILMDFFNSECSKLGIINNTRQLFAFMRTFDDPSIEQMSLFGEGS